MASIRFNLPVVCLGFVLSFCCCWFDASSASTFGFDIHHRFSNAVKGILPIDENEIPKIGSKEYYAFMAHRDRMLHGRRLSSTTELTKLTFEHGNGTFYIPRLGFLHYANVSIGTPSKSFLVALDTGSDLFWLPCDCTSCVQGLNTTRGTIEFNIYSPNASTTSEEVLCSSPLCARKRQCNSLMDTCPFTINYLSANTSANGILVEDVLHLVTDDDQSEVVKSRVTFGCGKELTGSFLRGGAPNGLFGLGVEDDSVPSMLASQGLIHNSFSLCFGYDEGIGRISFGDLGSSDQGETPFTLNQPHPSYNITVTKTRVGNTTSAVPFSAIFDSGTSFTFLSDPTYTYITESFHSRITEERYSDSSDYPFEYCYTVSGNQESYFVPVMDLIMKGGDTLRLRDPTIVIQTEASGYIFCLALLKSDDVNLIGQNFMDDYRFVFNRERNILGWKKSNCKDSSTGHQSISPGTSPAFPPAVAADPPLSITPNTSKTAIPPTGNNTSHSIKLTLPILAMIIISVLAIF